MGQGSGCQHQANAANIPIINFITPDPQASFNAYVGGDNKAFGRNWAEYLVDKKLVKSGDFVWMPVEVPGATYGVQEEEGIASVFKPLNTLLVLLSSMTVSYTSCTRLPAGTGLSGSP